MSKKSRWLVIPLLGFLAVVTMAEETSLKECVFRYETRRTKHAMGSKRHRHVTVDLGQGRIGVFAGFGKKDVEIFDLRTEVFDLLSSDRWFGDFYGIAFGDGKALLVDGKRDCVFDISSKRFTSTKNTFTGTYVRWPRIIPLPDGKLFLCGGFDDGFSPIDDCAVFDPKTLRFTAVGKLQVPRARPAVNRISDERVLISGGCNKDSKQSFDTMEIFDLTVGKSKLLTAKLHEPKSSHAGIVLSDGRVLLAGGYASTGRLNSAEVFDPKTSTTTLVGPLGLKRYGPQAALLPSGRVAIFGGQSDVRVVEVYCPKLQRFVLADQLLIDARTSGFTATPLKGVGILLVGGRVNDGGNTLDSAEIFTENQIQSQKQRHVNIDDLMGQLGHDDHAIRKAATRQLIEMGPDISTSIRKLLQHEDPEVRFRARTILTAITGGGSIPKWCVELWEHTTKQETLWFQDYSCPEYSKVDDARILILKQAVKQKEPTKLVVRFPPTTRYEQTVKLINLVGWSRFPVIYLGDVL